MGIVVWLPDAVNTWTVELWSLQAKSIIAFWAVVELENVLKELLNCAGIVGILTSGGSGQYRGFVHKTMATGSTVDIEGVIVFIVDDDMKLTLFYTWCENSFSLQSSDLKVKIRVWDTISLLVMHLAIICNDYFKQKDFQKWLDCWRLAVLSALFRVARSYCSITTILFFVSMGLSSRLLSMNTVDGMVNYLNKNFVHRWFDVAVLYHTHLCVQSVSIPHAWLSSSLLASQDFNVFLKMVWLLPKFSADITFQSDRKWMLFRRLQTGNTYQWK